MNIKLFFLIHNEKTYKRYYYQPLQPDNLLNRIKFQIKSYVAVFIKAAYLPFNSKYNTPQFVGGGERKKEIQNTNA